MIFIEGDKVILDNIVIGYFTKDAIVNLLYLEPSGNDERFTAEGFWDLDITPIDEYTAVKEWFFLNKVHFPADPRQLNLTLKIKHA